MFSKKCEYAIRAILFISQQSVGGNRVSPKKIAEAIDSPEAFTAKILQTLAKNNLINSFKGPHGGFGIDSETAKNSNVLDIVKAIDGDGIIKNCGLGLSQCDENNPCPLHFKFIGIRDNLHQLLASTTVEDLTHDLDKQMSFLK